MDLIAGCAAFVAVSRHASFTQGAAAAGIPQPSRLPLTVRSSAPAHRDGVRQGLAQTRQLAVDPFGPHLEPAP